MTFMKRTTFFFILILISCSSNKKFKLEMETVKNELEEMRIIDQYCANNGRPPDKFKNFPAEKWFAFRDSVFNKNQEKIEAYFNKYGYLGFDKVGEHTENTFWLLVQHSDKTVNFQKRVLEKLKIEVDKKNANPSNYALLYDRIKINTNERQLYATQVKYNKLGQATPKSLEDSINIDVRRKQYKLIPLKEYLNLLTKNHFEMNKDFFLKQGITEPNFYK